MYTIIFILLVISVATFVIINQTQFGKLPSGEKMSRIKNSLNFSDGQFKNLSFTPTFAEDVSKWEMIRDGIFKINKRKAPQTSLPSVKTEIKNLDPQKDVLIWFGHSSYFMQVDGKKILVDPVFSGHASPFSFMVKSFKGSDIYSPEDLPAIDYLIITHDHWDHLDYFSIIALKPKINHVVCGLGVGNYFAQWGFEEKRIHEADWYEQVPLEDNFLVHVLPARHYSGRMLSKDKTLWIGAAFVTRERRVFFSGDSGYGPHFKEIGERFHGFDLAILDAGQYDTNWPSIHMTPEEAAQAAEELQTHSLLLGHIGKFAIANHPWDEPFQRIVSASQNKTYQLLTPLIGEIVELATSQQVFSRWWEQVE